MKVASRQENASAISFAASPRTGGPSPKTIIAGAFPLMECRLIFVEGVDAT